MINWARLCRLLEATEFEIPTRKINMISKALKEESADVISEVMSILSLDLVSNDIALVGAKKWLTSIFEIHEDELDTYEDIGDSVYALQISKEADSEFSISGVLRLLNLKCSRQISNEFALVKTSLQDMSAMQRKWFTRYWLRTPRNGINSGLCEKIVAKLYDKKVKEVKKDLSFNDMNTVIFAYSNGENPPNNLSHGSFVKPMLAKEIPRSRWPSNCVVDYKYDGNRYQIHKLAGSVIIFNRKGSIVTKQFPDIVERVLGYSSDGILDGEIYPIHSDGSPAEHKLMGTRVHSKDVKEAVSKVPVKWVMFDCLKHNDETIMERKYSDRLKIMSENFPDQAHRMKKGGDIMAFYNNAINDGFEGIIVKDASLPYEAGKRSMGWAKYKPPRIELDVVILSAQYGEGKRANVFGTFEIGVKSDSGFTSLGNVGSGFTDAQLLSLTSQLRRNIETFTGGIYHFLPRVVLQVKADLVSQDQDGNYGLRFPRMERIRDDKFVADINTIEDVEALL